MLKHFKVFISILSLSLLLPNSLHAASVWNVAADGLSATLQPSPYDNDSDTSTTLSITGATVLNITITGESESNYDFLSITDASGNVRWFDGTVNTSYQVSGSSITLHFTSDFSITRTGFSVSITPNNPPVANAGADQSVLGGTALTLDASGSSDSDGNIVSYTWSDNGTDIATGVNPSVTLMAPGTHTITLTVTDDAGDTSSDTMVVTVTAPPLNAVGDSYSTTLDSPISGNFLSNDLGANVVYITNSATSPNSGTLVVNNDGSFTYTPNAGFAGTDTFSYTITDDNGGTDTATVTLSLATNYLPEGFIDFSLVNPPSTRNILGNYAIAGNTVTCLTEKTSGYGGTCHGDTDYQDETSNLHVNKYLDIDTDDRTWNSTSSYINLPSSYNQANGQGILWAALFWQGRFSTDTDYEMRYGIEDGNSFDLIEMGRNSGTYDEGDNIDVTSLGANKIKLKIDTADYLDTQATEVFTYESSNGVTYAAYADVTKLLQDANLSEGKHVFTVANLTTNEGHEASPGLFGGWSLIVIYKEFITGETRNISVYHGFQSLLSHPDPIRISGFKLPSSGAVSSQATVFSGEGEYRYGRNPYNSKYDWMKISNTLDGTYDYMPGPTAGTHVGNRDNMFDAKLTGILRDNIAGEFNDLSINNNGVDIDVFDVSSVMSNYRDADANLSELYLKVDSSDDYVTPSMIAFSTELYKPKVCYDYTIQKNGYDITNPDENRTIHSIGPGDLSINIALQSEEGDFDFENAQLSIYLDPLANTQYVDARYAPNNVNTLIPAIETSSHTTTKPTIAIGENVSLTGGTIRKDQRYFSEFNYNILSNLYDGRFELELNTTIDYGSGPVPVIQSTLSGEISRCDQSPYYNPIKGSFNIERPNSAGAPDEKFPLYTQVVGKDFDFEVVAYNQSATPPFSTELNLDGYTVDVELINARPFNDVNSTFVCNNPNPNIIQNLDANGTKHVFARFENNTSRVDLSSLNIQTDTALRNAAFRIYYIIDQNNTILKHECPYSADPEQCFEDLYANNIQADDNAIIANSAATGFCQTDCTDGGANSCYQCLRDYFSHAVCSRDNFAIRPAAYRLSMVDSNQSNDLNATERVLGVNNSPTSVATIAAGYKYRLKGVSTSFQGPDVKALGYNRTFDGSIGSGKTSKLRFDPSTGVNCLDQNDTDWDIRFIEGNITGVVQNGTDVNLTSGKLLKHSNVGKYNYYLHDANWTEVDHQDYRYKTFDSQDCIADTNIIAPTSTAQSGCNIDTNLTGDSNYENLALTYMPYKFDIDSITMQTIPSNGSTYIFMNDFNNDAYSDPLVRPLTMSVLFSGPVIAKGADDLVTTNFDRECAATQLGLNLARTMTPPESTIVDQSGTTVSFQQYLQNSSSITTPIDPLNKVLGSDPDANTTISLSAFDDGNASIRLHTNLKKPMRPNEQTAVNPVDINYTTLSTASYFAKSSADLSDDHIPGGKQDYNRIIRAYFSKITPTTSLYSDVEADFQMSAIYVDIFCDLAPATCAAYGLNTPSTIEGADWYSARSLPYNPISDGDTTLRANGIGNTVANINGVNPAENQPFDGPVPDGPGDMTDINVSLPAGAPKPATVDVSIEPDPWHLYEPTSIGGFPKYRIEFIGNSGWSGVGNTGEVIQIKSSGKTRGQRLNW